MFAYHSNYESLLLYVFLPLPSTPPPPPHFIGNIIPHKPIYN